MTCCCCGAYVPRMKQWPNRDTGYSICASCIQWLREKRGESEEEIRFLYGVEGVNFPIQEGLKESRS